MQYYNNLKELSRGTFGTIHLCETLHDKQKLVIKQIHLDSKENKLDTANNEVKILKSLNHPNIIKFYDNYHHNGIFYIVMEYATGGTLQQLIEKNKSIGFCPQSVMDFFCQILMGLDHIHDKNIIHRDLKTENIFLTGLNCDVIKIGDFGISKALLNEKKANTIIGTCNYLAPELCNGSAYNSKCDIWALGCILYELCAMEKMFTGPVANVVSSIIRGRIKQIDTKTYGVQMRNFIHKMLELKPENRPTTKDLIADSDISPTLYSLGVTLGSL
ncbi:unnamed protein product [Phyllotreta striolata]|uniref:non-specific serine/threonine protein kinase n=1 Tax=Phyllotreta striolata TaxID=444603 RepID=A0A9N9TTT1_PHYSR|nr:unnamed protein product [Phyllotreta striolata]